MNTVLYVFIVLILVLLNEFRLIKKYIRAHENNNKKMIFEKFGLFLIKLFCEFKNWLDHKVLNNELKY
jgi:hypothetical protein